jgi:hypothetical protein
MVYQAKMANWELPSAASQHFEASTKWNYIQTENISWLLKRELLARVNNESRLCCQIIFLLYGCNLGQFEHSSPIFLGLDFSGNKADHA